ncbi:MAG: hypothetical protein JWP91_1725 [Fibrobacteres bacterium]|nr:hypothetical protein [Fibrobacterota bacterium]
MIARIQASRSAGLAFILFTGLFLGSLLQGCAKVSQKDREFLSDPILQRSPDPLGEGMESHNLPRREGSAGGSSGSGGGCGC